MKAAVFIALGFLLYLMLCHWVYRQLRYRISRDRFQIILFGICLRSIPLTEIESVSKRRPEGWSEKWLNTFQPGHRMLAIRRKRGLRRHLLITPKNRYIFKTAIDRAIAQRGQPVPVGEQELNLITD